MPRVKQLQTAEQGCLASCLCVHPGSWPACSSWWVHVGSQRRPGASLPELPQSLWYQFIFFFFCKLIKTMLPSSSSFHPSARSEFVKLLYRFGKLPRCPHPDPKKKKKESYRTHKRFLSHLHSFWVSKDYSLCLRLTCFSRSIHFEEKGGPWSAGPVSPF